MKCPYFGKCGGCSSQHIAYDLQVQRKKEDLARLIKFEDIKIFTGEPFEYRNRLDLIFHSQGVGLRKKGKWNSIVDIQKCMISDDRINQFIDEIRDFFKDIDYFDLNKKKGTFKYVVIRVGENCSTLNFVLNSDSTRLKASCELVTKFSEVSLATNIIISYVPAEKDMSISEDFHIVKGDEYLSETFSDKTFYFHSQGFFQNNSQMTEQMLVYVKELLLNYETSNSHLLDLYGGVGTFGITNADLFKKVTIVELSEQSIDCANKNILFNKLANTEAIFSNANNLNKLKLGSPLFVITDPPRSGMDMKTLLRLKQLKSQVIIYVSCNPKQLAKDLIKLREYSIKSAALFDLFPQTPHSEAVIELVRKVE